MNLDEILTLIHTFNDSSLTELSLEQDGTSLSLKREEPSHPVYTQPIMVHPQAIAGGAPMMAGGSPAGTPVTGHPVGAPADAPPPQGAPAGTGPAGGSSVGGEADTPPPGVEVITSPIVGTIYRAASPDSPPFCQEGDVVEKGKTICILEAMKVMNELEAEFSMEIVAFKVNNGDMVEYGTPLVEVRRV